MRKLRVVTVTNNLDRNPHHWDDTEEFMYLIDEVEDEVETFVVDEDGGFWKASEFFHCTNITNFIVDSSEAPE